MTANFTGVRNPMLSKYKPHDPHPVGDIYGDVRLPAYHVNVVRDGKRHPISIEGRIMSCDLHQSSPLGHASFMSNDLACRKLAAKWREVFTFKEIDHWRWPPNKSAGTLDILAYNVMATMVVRLCKRSGISEGSGLQMLQAFPELRRDPDWLSEIPPDMTPA